MNGSTHTDTGGWFTWPEPKLVLGRGKVGVGLRTGPHRGKGAGATGFHHVWGFARQEEANRVPARE